MHTWRGFRWTSQLGWTYRPGIVGTYPLVTPSVVVDESKPRHQWPGGSLVIIWYSFQKQPPSVLLWFCEISKNTFCIEHLQMAASVIYRTRNWIKLSWISLFKVSYVVIKLITYTSHLLRMCLNNANWTKLIITITIKKKRILKTKFA